MMDENMKGQIVVRAEWRFPANGLDPIDVDGIVTSLQHGLTEAGFAPASINGFAEETVIAESV